MKWLLITTFSNPGDGFVRLGVQRLIREVDPDAQFELIDKEFEPTPWTKRDFDRCVLCGMPLFWDNPVSSPTSTGWWYEIFESWPTKNPSLFLALGVGDAFSAPPQIQKRHESVVSKLFMSSFAVTVRAPIPYVAPHQEWALINSICPAALVNFGTQVVKKYKLCNIMPYGAHDRHFNEVEAACWESKIPAVAESLKKDGFAFVAHNQAECDLSQSLGFSEAFYPQSLDEYASLYSQCGEYVGNRLHGAVITLGGGGRALGIGYDSRVNMVARLGGEIAAPSGIDPAKFITGSSSKVLMALEYRKLTELVKRFASQ